MTFCQKAVGRATAKTCLGGLGVALLIFTSCSPVIRSHGYVPTESDLATLQVGVDNQEDVTEAIGRPSFSGDNTTGGWYYLASTVVEFTYRRPEIIDRQLVAISFDDRGVVRNIERFGLEDGRVVALNRRVTDDPVAAPGIIRQLLGNIGTFTAGDVSSGP
ncbi:MAG: outer membrane protein assembly factor BamE [Paracoccaceae bacterium]|nr:outer membrane protein assembly factor BamE [Paracoccaceae bacterium]MDE2913188.1 outer membrane protein assembly factor BamE [Paracoccaceae bacterium]